MRVLPNHAHFALSHKILYTFVHFPNHRVQLPYLVNFHSCCLSHLLILVVNLPLLLVVDLVLEARVDRQGHLLCVQLVLHVGEYKRILPWNRCIKPENALVVPPARENYSVVGVEHEEIDQAVGFLRARGRIYEVSSTNISRFIWCIFVK